MTDRSNDSTDISGALIPAFLLVLATLLALYIILLPDNPDTLARARDGGVVRVGYALEAPFALLRADGQVSGESPEVLRAILSEQGIRRVDWLVSDFGDLLHELESGRIDIIAAGMFITPQRQREVLFSLPTALVRTGLLLPRSLPAPPATLAELGTRPEIRLAVVGGAIEAQLAEKAGVPPERIVAYPDPFSAVMALRDHRAEALALSAISLRFLVRQTGLEDFRIVDDALPGVPPGQPAFAFRRNDTRMHRRVDKALASYLGSPAHLARVGSFGISTAELPPPPGHRP